MMNEKETLNACKTLVHEAVDACQSADLLDLVHKLLLIENANEAM